MFVKSSVFAALAIVVGFGAAGCAPAKVTGGGWIEGKLDPSVKANFGFNGDSCNGPVQGKFNFHDKSASLKANGDVTSVANCLEPDADGELPAACVACLTYLYENPPSDDYTGEGNLIGVDFSYRSTNPKDPGEGLGYACVLDNGEGYNASFSDVALVAFYSGPYTGYVNGGTVQGNIQEHECSY